MGAGKEEDQEVTVDDMTAGISFMQISFQQPRPGIDAQCQSILPLRHGSKKSCQHILPCPLLYFLTHFQICTEIRSRFLIT